MAVNHFEELVRAALNAQGYLTFENAAYRLHGNAKSLAGQDNPQLTASDIDLIGFAPRKKGPQRVLAINCKGSREGLRLPADAERISGRTRAPVAGCVPETGFRELCQPDWAIAFKDCIYRWTGERSFMHVMAVRSYTGEKRLWSCHPPFQQMLTEHLDIWDLDHIVRKIHEGRERLHVSNSVLKLVDLLYRPA
ncbi:hypothetical protein [Sphingobium lignivorans]|uniref:Restriction endonuclease n=1 Tax=Sphingobium lignivorans TaxID=2735886 RepID=A0ABR6NFH4_9SPHN|nr:hypothetical protein [Sphingobium lignivorans]MBB5986042.1 hypothetical protein [Sphingobium lignivorans]